MKPQIQEGVVYVLQREGSDLYKIGSSTNSGEVRRRSMQTASPEDLILLGEYHVPRIRRTEDQLQKLLENHCVAREWFELTPKLLKGCMLLLEALSEAAPGRRLK